MQKNWKDVKYLGWQRLDQRLRNAQDLPRVDHGKCLHQLMQGTGHGQQTGATESDDMTNMTNMTRKYQKIVFKVDFKRIGFNACDAWAKGRKHVKTRKAEGTPKLAWQCLTPLGQKLVKKCGTWWQTNSIKRYQKVIWWVGYESQTWQRLVQSESPVPSQCWVWRLQAAQQSLQNDIVKRHETTSFCKRKFWICSSSCFATMLLHFIVCLCKTRKKWTHLPVLQLKVALSSVHHRIVLTFSGARCTKSWSMRSAEDLTVKAKLFERKARR